MVWLGRKDERSFAMKQFPKQPGQKVDPSAYVELQIHQLMRNNSTREGKRKRQPNRQLLFRLRTDLHDAGLSRRQEGPVVDL